MLKHRSNQQLFTNINYARLKRPSRTSERCSGRHGTILGNVTEIYPPSRWQPGIYLFGNLISLFSQQNSLFLA
jgi:hypothetical protein